MNIEYGWAFHSADFSRQAAGETKKGGVMLVRDQYEKKKWHLMSEEMQEKVELYVNGFGETLEDAIIDANLAASHARPIVNNEDKKYKFQKTYCSQCGSEFNPGNEGFSNCVDHENI